MYFRRPKVMSPDNIVKDMQRMLNEVRPYFLQGTRIPGIPMPGPNVSGSSLYGVTSGNWPVLATDGLYGAKTEQALVAFKKCMQIRSNYPDEVGDTTWNYLKKTHQTVRGLSSKQLGPGPAPKTQTRISSDKKSTVNIQSPSWLNFICGIIDEFWDRMGDFLELGDELLDYLQKTGRLNEVEISKNLRAHLNKNERFFQKLQTSCEKAIIDREVVNKNDVKSISRKGSSATVAERQIMGDVSRAQNNLKFGDGRTVVRESKKLVQVYKETNIFNKIDQFVKRISKSTNINKLNNVNSAQAFKNAGKKISYLKYLDLFLDLINFIINGFKEGFSKEFWSTYLEKWWNNSFKKHLCEFIDGVIIGIVVNAIVTAIVGGIIGAAVVGWVAVVVAIVVAVIVAIIMWLFNKYNFSLTEFVVNGVSNFVKSLPNPSSQHEPIPVRGVGYVR